EELHRYFTPWINEMSSPEKTREENLEDIKLWYNGYSWDGESFVYNPFSILNLFQEKRFGNYWFSTGTPSFLIKMIKEKTVDVKKIGSWEVGEYVLNSYDIENMDVVSLLFQTGYVSIKDIKNLKNTRKYRLAYPNLEVKDAFLKYLLADLAESSTGLIDGKIFELSEHLENHDLDSFFDILKALFAGIPYNVFIKDKEAYYHSLIYLILTLVGINIQAEIQTNKGRIDARVECGDTIYIMEFKMGSHEKAMKQIKKMNYHQKYMQSGKEIRLVGIGFD
ncbi:MAG: AAA family ATPase, partial [bacterium]|nr:AAA family ATPase [bacterium]